MSTLSIAIVNSLVYGSTTNGKSFNDVEAATYTSAGSNITINSARPIKKIAICHGTIVDGITITYAETGSKSRSETITHGTEFTTQAVIRKDSFDLDENENIIAVSGRAGETAEYGGRVCQISFTIYNSNSGTMKVYGPYGNQDGRNAGTPFRVTANGFLLGFTGYAITSSDNVATDKQIGLFGLGFADVAYRTT